MAGGDIDGPVNIGNGRATSFTDLARLVCDAAGYEPEIQYLPDKPAGAQYRVADTDKLLDIYEPQVTLEEGIARALDAA
jgi:nucleoside-diphosphate-sugar epimerase